MINKFKTLLAVWVLSLATSFQAPSVAHADIWDESCEFTTLSESSKKSEFKTLSITVFGPVGPEMYRQLTSVSEITFLNFPEITTVKLNLSSTGGTIDAGVAIRNFLLGLEDQHGIKLIAHNIGDVSSAAIDIFCAASERYASPNTVFLIHHGQGDLVNQQWNDLDNLREQKELEVQNSIDMFTACTGMDPEQANKLYTDQTTFGPDQAVDFGLIRETRTATYDKSVDISCKLEIPTE